MSSLRYKKQNSKAIVVKGLTKSFGKSKVLREVSFDASWGEVKVILGVNGAGKTTLMRILSTILDYDGGSVKINNLEVREHKNVIRELIGYVPELPVLPLHVTAYEFLSLIAYLRDIPKNVFKKRLNYLMRELYVNFSLGIPIGNMSKGMRQKVVILSALLHVPKVLLLDEPLLGLDPISIYYLKRYLVKLKNQGACIIISTHLIWFAEEIADTITILHNGKSVISGNLNYILRVSGCDKLEDAFIKIIEESDVDSF